MRIIQINKEDSEILNKENKLDKVLIKKKSDYK